MNKWFTSNKLTLNLDKTNVINFITNKSPQYDLKIGYDEKYIEESMYTKYLGLQIHNNLNWKNHIELMLPKLSRACYAVRSLSLISSTDTFKSIYFAYFHSIMKCGFMFWGNSPNSVMIFTLWKRTVGIIAGVKSRNSCRNLLMRLDILPLSCKYIFTSMNFVVITKNIFRQTQQTTVLTLGIGTIFIGQLPTFHVFKKSAYYASIKIFNSLP
jgi:hypothetical protein